MVRALLGDPGFARHFSESLAERLRWTAEPSRVVSGGDLHLPVERLVRRAAADRARRTRRSATWPGR